MLIRRNDVKWDPQRRDYPVPSLLLKIMEAGNCGVFIRGEIIRGLSGGSQMISIPGADKFARNLSMAGEGRLGGGRLYPAGLARDCTGKWPWGKSVGS